MEGFLVTKTELVGKTGIILDIIGNKKAIMEFFRSVGELNLQLELNLRPEELHNENGEIISGILSINNPNHY